MYVALHECAERLVHETVTLNAAEVGELRRHDTDLEMSPAVRRTGMPSVTLTIVDYL
jgi:hypothetical protein